jgi:LacI family transcriptional regulator
MNKRPSLKDIAQKVGVSTALVSYVLNNKKEGRISKSISEKIRDVARDLNYRTNQIARSLKTSKTLTIGLIVADISNPFSSTLARIIEDEAGKKNYTVIFGSSDENEQKCGKLIEAFLNRQVDGLIIAAPEHSEPHIKYLLEQNMPFVLIDRYFPSIKTNYVALDNFEAAYKGVNYLLQQGCRKVGIISYQTSLVHLKDRTIGYKEALSAAGIPFNEHWLKEIDLGDLRDEIIRSINELVYGEEKVDAIFFASNRIATIGLKHLNNMPLRVPRDLSIMCFDESDTLDLFYAPLPFIRQPLQEMGNLATHILIESMDKNDEVTQANLPAELIIRTA